MSTAEVIDLSNEIVPSKREREDSQVQPKAVKKQRVVNVDLEQEISDLTRSKCDHDFPRRCMQFAMDHLPGDKTTSACIPQSTAKGKELRKILVLGIACHNVGLPELKRCRGMNLMASLPRRGEPQPSIGSLLLSGPASFFPHSAMSKRVRLLH